MKTKDAGCAQSGTACIRRITAAHYAGASESVITVDEKIILVIFTGDLRICRFRWQTAGVFPFRGIS